MRTRYRTVLAGVAVMATVVTACAQPRPPEHSAIEAGARYVALGSSFASGPGLGPMPSNGCLRSTANYASYAAAALNLRLTDVSCASATTDNIVIGPQRTGAGEQPPQIAAVTPETRLVTLTIGGNDVGYASALDKLGCADAGTCSLESVDEGSIRDATDGLSARLVTAIEAIRAAAPEADVLLVTYPQIVPADGSTCPALVLSADHAAAVAAIGARLDEAFRSAASTTGIRLIDVYAASADHTACASDAWVSGWVDPDDPSGYHAYHPTGAGMRAVAGMVVAAVG